MSPLIDALAARVHDSYVQDKTAAGVTSLPSRRGTGDLMRPFADLDDADREDDRRTVRTVLLGLAELDPLQVWQLLDEISGGAFIPQLGAVIGCDQPSPGFVERCVEAATGEEAGRGEA